MAEAGSYPNASALTGTERLVGDQSAGTVNITPTQIVALSAGILLTPSGDTSGATDFAAIQAAITTVMQDTSAGITHRAVIFSGGYYYINAKLVAAYAASSASWFGPVTFLGIGKVVIQQVTDNTGLLEFQIPDGSYPRGLRVRNLGFTWLNAQTGAQTNSVGIGFRCTVTPSVSGPTMFDITMEDLIFNNAYRCIANTQPAGQMTTWQMSIRDCEFYSAGAAVYLSSPTPAGQPQIRIERCVYSPIAFTQGTEAAFTIANCDSLVFDNVEVLSLYNYPAFAAFQGNIVMNSCRVERHRAQKGTGAYLGVISLQNMTGTIANFAAAIYPGVSGAGGLEGALLNLSSGSLNNDLIVGPISLGLYGTDGVTAQTANFYLCTSSGPQTARWIASPDINPAALPQIQFANRGNGVPTKYVRFSAAPGGESTDDMGDLLSATGSASGNVLTITAVAAGALHIGDLLTGTGVPAGSYILAYGTGTGNTGTYYLATSGGFSSTANLANTAFWVLPLYTPRTIIYNTALTATREVHCANAAGFEGNLDYDGAEVEIIRTKNCTGAFNINLIGQQVMTTTALTTAGSRIKMKYREGIGWLETDLCTL